MRKSKMCSLLSCGILRKTLTTGNSREKLCDRPMFQAMRDALAEQKQNPLSIDDVTAMVLPGQIGQLAPMDEETADPVQAVGKKDDERNRIIACYSR